MSDDLRAKLKRLGVHKGPSHLKTPAAKESRQTAVRHDVQSVLGGCQVETPAGMAYVVIERFGVNHVHGSKALSRALKVPASALAQCAAPARLAGDPLWQEINLARAAFLDTETTGLAGGTGTLAFLVGVGRFQIPGSKFEISQFFLRHPGEEEAMLTALQEMLADCEAVVTFNGRGFDMPLLQTRFTLNRMFPPILNVPNLDLLPPARRVWRDRLESCALSSLEVNVLGVHREQADVPGALIPQMYFDYLSTGDASEMPRVLYHNAQDILSMVTLVTCLGRMLTEPMAMLDSLDLVSIARWYDDLGLADKAEAAFRAALAHPLPIEAQTTAWQRWGYLLKRQERYKEATQAWEQLAATGDITAHVELAKHYEWRLRDVGAALAWTEAALKQVEVWQSALVRRQARDELLHRKKRLERKTGKQKE